jgi:thioredoxin 2
MSPKALTAQSLNETLKNSQTPVLVEFFAPWCGHCKTMSPLVDAAAQALSGQAQVAQVDIEAEPQLTEAYQIDSVPTFLAFNNGREVARQTGTMSQEDLQRFALSAR